MYVPFLFHSCLLTHADLFPVLCGKYCSLMPKVLQYFPRSTGVPTARYWQQDRSRYLSPIGISGTKKAGRMISPDLPIFYSLYFSLVSYFTKAAKSEFVAYLANSKSIAASLAMFLSLAIASFKLLTTPFALFVRAATTAFK